MIYSILKMSFSIWLNNFGCLILSVFQKFNFHFGHFFPLAVLFWKQSSYPYRFIVFFLELIIFNNFFHSCFFWTQCFLLIFLFKTHGLSLKMIVFIFSNIFKSLSMYIYVKPLNPNGGIGKFNNFLKVMIAALIVYSSY